MNKNCLQGLQCPNCKQEDEKELTIIFEIADRSIYSDFAAVADDLDLADKLLFGLQDKLHEFLNLNKEEVL